MKQITFFILSILFTQFTVMAQESSYSDSFPEKWERSKNYSIAVIQEMPFEKFDMKVAEDVMSFQEELAHTITNFEKLQYYVTGSKDCAITGYGEQIKNSSSKEEITSLYEKGFQHIDTLWDSLSEDQKNTSVENFFAKDVNMTKRDIFYLMRNHVTHHRGRLTLQMRIAGVKPPRYIGW
ncbi:DinB family protein [Sediminitomix flava]|uniref:Putative damage-inducible protein DinB n=1 Tax=Sediminitomix flava TaxID=379075 RepID=A0A315Z7Z7_SEDFL|nr:DinB family protein [Sediminitomix flava]PWJ41082.1 putative damage-inducible protein DinB [Sediminitomix flava]